MMKQRICSALFFRQQMLIVLVFLLLVCGLLPAGAVARSPRFELDYSRQGPHGRPNRIEAKVRRGKVVFTISSQFGIGSASIQLVRGRWPEEIRFHLYLGGLEGVDVSAGSVRLARTDLGVTIRDSRGRVVEGKYVQQLDDDVKAGAYYEVVVPPSVELPPSGVLKIHWIDFYRG